MLARLFHQSPRQKMRRMGDCLVVLDADCLLAPRLTLLEAIRSMVGVPDGHWEKLYQPLVEPFTT